MLAFIGAYTKQGGGIHCCRMDGETGRLSACLLAAEAPNPSYLALSGDGKRLYAVMETAEYGGAPGGAVAAYAVEPSSGALAELGRQSTTGAYPCHLAVDEARRRLYAANYGGGTVTAFPLLAGGTIGPAAQVLVHEGSGPDPARQEGPHAHCALPTPDGKLLLAVDLGIDAVVAYRADGSGRLIRDEQASIRMRPGCGPRHIAFDPAGRIAYVITELSNEIAAFAWREAEGSFRELAAVSTLPPGHVGRSYGAAVRVHPSGRFLYASNRGHDSIAVFRIGRQGVPEPAGHVPCGGEWPRDINLTPDGRFLYAACEHSHAVTAFAVDPRAGGLAPLGVVANVPSPTCVVFG